MTGRDGFNPGPFTPTAEELASTGNATLTNPISADGTPELGKTYTIPARQGLAVRLTKGQSVRVINTHGQQVVDSWAFNAQDTTEFMSMEHIRPDISSLFPRAGHRLVTNKRRPILTFMEDTSPGVHDTVCAACDYWRYRNLGVEGYHDNCTDNLRMAMHAIGSIVLDVPSPFNIFMNIPVTPEGGISYQHSVSGPGEYVTFRAEMDCIYAMSACPQDQVPLNGDDMIIRDAHMIVTA